MRIYSKHTRRNVRYYLRVMTQDLQAIDLYTLVMAAAALLAMAILPGGFYGG